MNQNTDNKIEFKEKLISFYNINKFKIYSFLIVLLIIIVSFIFFTFSNEKKNNLISEKYVEAGLYLASKNMEKSKILYEEIIFSKNKFYSILALNIILEKDLVSDKSKIISYFESVEELKLEQEQKDLVIFKKALYLIKISNTQEGYILLKNLIEENSKLKTLAEEIIAK